MPYKRKSACEHKAMTYGSEKTARMRSKHKEGKRVAVQVRRCPDCRKWLIEAKNENH
jgi:hypothetical protein